MIGFCRLRIQDGKGTHRYTDVLLGEQQTEYKGVLTTGRRTYRAAMNSYGIGMTPRSSRLPLNHEK